MSAPRLRYFDYDSLTVKEQLIAIPFYELVNKMLEEPNVDEDEIEMGLRKLLEARDCFLRAQKGLALD